MAQFRMLSWNIEVWGPQKYGNSPNNLRLVNLVASVAAQANLNVLVLMELTSSVAPAICFNVGQALNAATGHAWAARVLPARPGGDKESYGIFWRTDDAFAVVLDGAGAENVALSTLQFPNNFSATNGRRAALATLRTADTAVNVAVSVYHAPPNARATQGLEALAKTPALYAVDNAGAAQAVTGRLLGGDYNLDVNVQPEYTWLTNPVPAAPPPAAAGEGAGSTAITTQDTSLITMAQAVARWGNDIANWSVNPVDYRGAQYDNIFHASPAAAPAAVGGVYDLIGQVMLPGSPVRAVAQQFVTLNAATGMPAFPSAFSLPLPLAVNLSNPACAWLLARYGVSDHLPVLAQVTI